MSAEKDRQHLFLSIGGCLILAAADLHETTISGLSVAHRLWPTKSIRELSAS